MSKTILETVHETAKGLYSAGAIDKVTMHEFDNLCLSPLKQMKPNEIKKLRLENKVSQPVFAKYLNVRPVTVKKWELGEKHPSGASLKLLYTVKNNGLQPLQF